MFIDLALAFDATIPRKGQEAPDANLSLVAVAVMLGHAKGSPMTALQIASRINAPRGSVSRRLDVLVARGLIQKLKGKYYLEPVRAAH
jgi:DNA-binding MarR family transcriptional regulator